MSGIEQFLSSPAGMIATLFVGLILVLVIVLAALGRRDKIMSERLDDVIVGAAIGFVKLFFHRFEFMHRSLGHTVDAGDELVRGLFPVGHIIHDASQPTRDSNEFNACHVLWYTSRNGRRSTSRMRPCRAITVSWFRLLPW